MAAIWVVVYHYGRSSIPFGKGVLNQIASHGQVAVSFFFFLSGLVLTINYFNKPNLAFKPFFLKRVARIYPIYFIAFITALLLSVILSNARPSVGSVVLHAFSLHAWVPKFSLQINYPAWSIVVEMFFYVLFPFLIRYLKSDTFRNIALKIIGFWIASNLLNYYLLTYHYQPNTANFGKFLMYFPLMHLNTFLVGILAGTVILKYKNKALNFVWVLRINYLVGSLLLFLIFTTNNPFVLYINNGLLAPLFFIVLVGLALDVSLLTKALSNKFLVFLGDSSYGVYILQFPIYLAMQHILQKETLQGFWFYCYLISLILVSSLMYVYFEKKARNYLLIKWKLATQ